MSGTRQEVAWMLLVLGAVTAYAVRRSQTADDEAMAVGPATDPATVDPKAPKKLDFVAAEIYGWTKLCAEEGYGYDPNRPYRCTHTRATCRQGPGRSTSSAYGDYGEWHNGRCIAMETELRDQCRRAGLTTETDPSGVYRCKTNPAYCKSKGLQWSGSDCRLPTEQRVAEEIFGTTLTRATKSFFEDEVACLFGAFC